MRTGKINQSSSGLLNAGTWQLVEEKLLTEAATSVTFSNLNGDVDQEYRLVSRIVNGYNGACGWFLQPNGDTTAAHYGGQNLSGINASVGAARSTLGDFYIGGGAAALGRIAFSDLVLHAKSGYVRTSIEKFCYDITTTTVTGTVLLGRSWNNTADNITSLVILSDQASGLGAGTHLLLFKRNLLGTVASSGIKTGTLNVQGAVNCGVMQKIYQTTLTEAATSVTISNLDGNTDTLYELRVRTINGYNGAQDVVMYVNADQTNYGYQYLRGINTTVTAGRGTITSFYKVGGGAALNNLSLSKLLLYSKSGYVRTALIETTNSIATTTVTEMGLWGISWNDTSNNITSMTILSAANGLGIGTVIELWALRKKL